MKAAWSELAVLRIRILAPALWEREEKAELELDLDLEKDMVVLSAWDAVMDATDGVGIDDAAAAEEPREDIKDTSDAEELWDDVNVNLDDAAAADAVADTGITADDSSRLALGI